MLALVCPGQGAQTPGFLTPWLAVPGVGDRLQVLSEAVGPLGGADLITHGTTSDAETIRDTAVAQPLLVAAALAVAGAVWAPVADAVASGSRVASLPGVGVVAGHSVGEFTAAALAGVLTPREAVELVRERGRAMAAAAATRPTGMCAVVGGVPEEVEAAIERSGAVAANRNGSGQVVAAGTLEQLAALAADPPARARVVPLAVAGAFHTEHMAPAVAALAERAGGVAPSAPVVPLLSNADGEVVTGGDDALARLVAQVARPVRWDACTARMGALGVDALLELPPAGTLTGLAKRALPGVALLALRGPDDLAAASALIDADPIDPDPIDRDTPRDTTGGTAGDPQPTGSPA